MFFIFDFTYSDIGFIIVNEKLNIVEANDYMIKNFDVLPEGLIGVSLFEISKNVMIERASDDAPYKDYSLIDGVLKVIKDNVHIENIVISYGQTDNNQKFYKINAFPQDCNSEKYAIVSFSDITKRKYIENLYKKNQNKYSILFENITQGFALHEIITGLDGKPCDYRFIDVNPAFEKLTGRKAADIIGKRIKEIMPLTGNRLVEKFGKVALTGVPCHFEDFSSELKKYYEVSAFCPQKGQFAILLFDITDRKNIENALSASENRFKNYIDNAPDGVFIADLQGNYITVNEAVCHMTGYSKAELLNKNVLSLTPEAYKTKPSRD
jgi:PAS domain S-box